MDTTLDRIDAQLKRERAIAEETERLIKINKEAGNMAYVRECEAALKVTDRRFKRLSRLRREHCAQ